MQNLYQKSWLLFFSFFVKKHPQFLLQARNFPWRLEKGNMGIGAAALSNSNSSTLLLPYEIRWVKLPLTGSVSMVSPLLENIVIFLVVALEPNVMGTNALILTAGYQLPIYQTSCASWRRKGVTIGKWGDPTVTPTISSNNGGISSSSVGSRRRGVHYQLLWIQMHQSTVNWIIASSLLM